ncbi:cytoplasmic protein [Ruicaihuangia caeni]|uniref:Cytoplasmic protein n=1 Tax=Ruicaihuangia caeni TaxID=3042517 RepID=A0AAW6T5E4_9MICO|nr:cytoplasmic protein [Klugiella sp. YN-L-19]MDI2098311.1 cytoplasmic protein [Klugiella sp. YN-L-19]
MPDPIDVNPKLYRVVFENARVRVLEYFDRPGDATVTHSHPDSVMITLSDFDRRLTQGERTRDLHLDAFQVRWLDAQDHSGANIGSTDTHAFFVELKERDSADAANDAHADDHALGPTDPPPL